MVPFNHILLRVNPLFSLPPLLPPPPLPPRTSSLLTLCQVTGPGSQFKQNVHFKKLSIVAFRRISVSTNTRQTFLMPLAQLERKEKRDVVVLRIQLSEGLTWL